MCTRDARHQSIASELGATWVCEAAAVPPVKLDGAINFAPAGQLVPPALRALDKASTLVLGGIHMSDIPSFPYRLLWEERMIRTVANLTRQDGIQFLTLAQEVPIKTETKLFALQQANEALENLRTGKIQGAAVLVMPFSNTY